tara:strand:+ start:47028 stop:47903 length:876 start_codon:yes stop_codon:yes gene_type:complete
MKEQSTFPLESISDEPETICRDCAFAVYDGKTQTGCSLEKIEKFKKQGAEILEVYDEENKEFFVIKGRVCVFWRGGEWQEKNKGRKDWEDIVNKETMTRMEAIIYLDKNSTLMDLDKTVTSLQTGIFKPMNLTMINNHSSIEKMILARVGMESSLKWRVENIRDPASEDDTGENTDEFNPDYEFPERYRCVDIALQKSRAKECNYYFIFDAGKTVPKNFISDISNSINIDMNRFLALRGDENGDGDVGQVHMHKQMGGNRTKRFLDKIENTTKSQGCPQLLQNTSEIVSST